MHLIARCLLWFPPEVAHRIAMSYFRLFQWVHFRIFRRGLPQSPAIHLTELPKLKFASRLGLAAGFDKNAEAFAALSTLGFGFIEVGTVTPLPQPGNAKPRLWRQPGQSLVNFMGFNNEGVEAFRRHLLQYRRFIPGFPLLANLGKGKETPLEQAVEDYRISLEKLKDCVDGFVINVSSPNTPNLRSLQNVAFLESVVRIAPPSIPLWMKFSPDLEDSALKEMLEFIKSEPVFSGVVLTNTSPRLAAEKMKSDRGGLSGPPLFPRTLECVAMARTILGPKKTIVGVGGVKGVKDAQALREAGADLIEIYTAFIYHGPKLVRELSRALV